MSGIHHFVQERKNWRKVVPCTKIKKISDLSKKCPIWLKNVFWVKDVRFDKEMYDLSKWKISKKSSFSVKFEANGVKIEWFEFKRNLSAKLLKLTFTTDYCCIILKKNCPFVLLILWYVFIEWMTRWNWMIFFFDWKAIWYHFFNAQAIWKNEFKTNVKWIEVKHGLKYSTIESIEFNRKLHNVIFFKRCEIFVAKCVDIYMHFFQILTILSTRWMR